MNFTLRPTHGRDYGSSRKVLEAFLADTDFVVASDNARWAGKNINKSMIEDLQCTEVTIRYDAMTRVTVLHKQGDSWEVK